MTHLDIAPALPREQATIANLMQLYTHDFSEQWAGLPRGELDDEGRFPDYPLGPYWREADHIPLLIRADGFVAGFALLNALGRSGRPVDRNMAEFFIVRKHRRGGVGTQATRAIFARYPGQWEAAVARRNTAALAFWRSAVRGCDLAEAVEEFDRVDAEWNGPVLRFNIRAP